MSCSTERFHQSLDVLHSCDDPGCVDPEHLHVGTHADNMREMKIRDRVVSGKNHCLSVLKEEQVREIRKIVSANPNINVRGLARQYGVDHTTIFNIIHHKTWNHLS